MKIVSIDTDSPLFGKVNPGAELMRVNGQAVADHIDYHFCNTEETLVLEVREGEKVRKFELPGDVDPGIELEQMKIRVCRNKCIFCFVHQQPKGMRRSLYIKDDDFRFSFTHGNFITLSDMTDADFERIIRQRLSPMYISVHATDDTLRRCIFQNERLEPVLPRLKQLVDNDIAIHAQTVVCPGINDGRQLEKTIEDLAALMPGVESLAVVPVGLTKYRERLPKLRTFSSEDAAGVLRIIGRYQRSYIKEHGHRFVFPADEFFINAGKTIPPLSYYEDMPQFENGVGMVRQFIVDFNRRKRYLPIGANRSKTITIVTGKSADLFMRKTILPRLEQIKILKTNIVTVENQFWGRSVTVTGLLTGEDIARAVEGIGGDIVLLPPNCTNAEDLFLDDMSLDAFSRRVGSPVITGSYDIAGLVRRAIELEVN